MKKILEEPEITAGKDLLHEKASADPMYKVLPMSKFGKGKQERTLYIGRPQL